MAGPLVSVAKADAAAQADAADRPVQILFSVTVDALATPG